MLAFSCIFGPIDRVVLSYKVDQCGMSRLQCLASTAAPMAVAHDPGDDVKGFPTCQSSSIIPPYSKIPGEW